MRAVIYARVSSDQTGQGRSVESQETECRTECHRNGWDVAEVLVDNDRGASRFSLKGRPEYTRLKKVLKSGDVLVTWEASRAQRDLEAYVTLRNLCAERGVLWSYSGRTYDLTKGDDRFSTGLDALLAEKEAEQIRERVLRGKRSAAIAGRPGGRPPFGYRRAFDPTTGRTTGWEIDPETSPIIRDIIDRALAGVSLWTIARQLNTRGIEPPQTQSNSAKTWVPARIRSTILRPTYAGLRVYQGNVVGNGNWPALMTVEEHERLKAILLDPTRLSHHGVEPKHFLSGIARCGKCGKPVGSTPPTKRGKTRGYRCPNGCVRRRQDLVDRLVEQTLVFRLSRPDAAEIFTPQDVDNTADLEKLEQLRLRLDEAIAEFASGNITATTLAKVEGKLQPQITELEQRRKPQLINPQVEKLIGPHVEEKWAQLTIHERREIARGLLDIRIHSQLHGTSRQFSPDDVTVTWLTEETTQGK